MLVCSSKHTLGVVPGFGRSLSSKGKAALSFSSVFPPLLRCGTWPGIPRGFAFCARCQNSVQLLVS